MDVICDIGRGLIHKRARTDEERRRLASEAALLGVVAHPGVVQLLGVEGQDPPDGLVLRRVGGGDLAGLDRQPATAIASLGAALATTVADLHDVGVSHGAIEAAHVLLDEEGRPVLCSFGRARRTPQPARAALDRRRDVRALARLLLQLMPPGTEGRATRLLRVAAGPGRQRRCHDARWLARRLIATVPGAHLPAPAGARARTPIADQITADLDPGTTVGDRRGGRRAADFAAGSSRRLAATIGGLGLLGATATVVATLLPATPPLRAARPAPLPPVPSPRAPGTSPPASLPFVPCPPADAGCLPVAAPGGVLTAAGGRYQLGTAGDVIVLGRWQCGPTAEPALLRPSTGEVWTFDGWPDAGRPEAGRLAARLDAARSLRVRPQRSGCDRLEVERQGMPAVTVGNGHSLP